MAGEDSLFWDGTVTGDAAGTNYNAPYSSLEYSDMYSKLLGSDAARAYIIPSYANNLRVKANSPAALNVLVDTGAAELRGKLYVNSTQQTVSLAAADATNPRLDRIILRITFASQTIRVVALTGTPAATPSLPALTQNATTYEISLAHVWVAATATTIAEADVHDERIFAANLEGLLTSMLQQNLISNSEFMAFSRLNTVNATSAGAPDHWQTVGTVTTWASATKPATMSRGRYVSITAGAGGNAGMSYTFRCKASTNYAFKVLYNLTAGDNGSIQITTNSGAPVGLTRTLKRTGADLEELLQYTTESDASTLTIKLLASASTDIIKYGQCLAVEGFVPGPYRQIHETILFGLGIGDTNWNNTAKGSATTTIDLDTDFQGLILPGTLGVIFRLSFKDSASSGAAPEFGVHVKGESESSFIAINSNLTNNSIRIVSGWVYLDLNSQVDFEVIASAGTNATCRALIFGILI